VHCWLQLPQFIGSLFGSTEQSTPLQQMRPAMHVGQLPPPLLEPLLEPLEDPLDEPLLEPPEDPLDPPLPEPLEDPLDEPLLEPPEDPLDPPLLDPPELPPDPLPDESTEASPPPSVEVAPPQSTIEPVTTSPATDHTKTAGMTRMFRAPFPKPAPSRAWCHACSWGGRKNVRGNRPRDVVRPRSSRRRGPFASLATPRWHGG
jgi:hypothetical protein